MQIFWILIATFLIGVGSAMAKPPVEVDTESLMALPEAQQKGDAKKEDEAADKEDEKPSTPAEQALMICQTADMMNKKLDGPEYKAGVDAYGRDVAPADVYNAMPFEVPDQVEVPIAMDVMAALGVNAPPLEGKGKVGNLTIFKSGQLLYNGKDITNTVEGYCRQHMKKMEEKK